MGSCAVPLRLRAAVLLLILLVPAVSGWTLQNFSVTPAGADYPPGSPVTAVYSIHFDSWMTGSTFESDNSLTMYTDLASPHWTVSKTETLEGQDPIVESIPVRQSQTAKLDGWTLSYVRKRFDISVQLTGTTPALNQSGDIAIVRLQEVAPGAKPVSGTLIRKETHITIPTPVPTATPEMTPEATPEEVIVITPEPTPVTPAIPATKATYSPGPGPVAIGATLAFLVILARVLHRNP